MLKLFSITRPFYSASILQLSVDIPLLGTRYLGTRYLSTTPSKLGKQDRAEIKEAIERLSTLVRLRKYKELFKILKVETSLPYKAFQRVLQYKIGVSPVREIEIKEKIVEIMEKRGMVLDASSIVPLISLYGKAGDLKKADAMLQTMKDYGIERTAGVYTSLIKCHERDLSMVDSLFKEMIAAGIKPNVYSYTSMIDAFSKGGNHEKAVGLLSRMKEEGIEPNVVTYTSLIKCHDLDLSKVDSLFKEMIAAGIKLNVYSYTSMIDAFSKGGNHEKAVELLSRMKEEGIEPNVVTYTSLIKCHELDLSKVDSLFKEMIAEGIKPSVVTYNSMIDAFSKGGDFDKAAELLSRMKEEGVKPDSVTYMIMNRER
jgi:pentatricopeptide repeat protein